MEPSLLEVMIKGSIYLGIKKVTIRPYMNVTRCRKCQAFGHAGKMCRNAHFCENWYLNDPIIECTVEPIGINCWWNNEDNKTSYNTNHKASDLQCPTFRARYTTERIKLDKQYALPSESGPCVLIIMINGDRLCRKRKLLHLTTST